jgi:hypothetical protein
MAKTFIEEAMSIFPDSRSLTKEEAVQYEKVLNSLGKPTGRKLFNLSEEGEIHGQSND